MSGLDAHELALVDAPRQLKTTLTDDEIADIAEKLFTFAMEATGIKLYPYQQDFGRRIILSLLKGDGEEITALFARQSGKTETVAVMVCGIITLLPTLAKMPGLCEDDRVSKFADGVWVGIFAPTYELGGIMYQRMATRMRSQRMVEVLQEPELDMELPEGRQALRLPNGSFVDCNSASPGTHIEGKTLHLIICEECQDISNYKIRKSIHPMGAATNATLVKIGTPNPYRNDFFEACERNRKHDLDRGGIEPRHFQFDYEYAQRYNPMYRKYIEKEVERLGYDSDDFRMSYRLHWLLERGTFISPEIMDSAGIQHRDKMTARVRGKHTAFIRPDYPGTQDRTTENQVASIDIGRTHDSTVVTVARVWWDNPQSRSGEDRFYTHIMNWFEIQGDDHESQYPQIVDFLKNYRLGKVVVDATGRGDPVFSRLKYDLSEHDIDVVPFVFSQRSKHDGYTLLNQELREGRLTFPAGAGAKKQRKWIRFNQQMFELERTWRGKYMVVEAPKSHSKGKYQRGSAHDDYPDSLMMLCWAINGEGMREAEVSNNPFVGKHALGDSLRRSRAWFQDGYMNRRKLTEKKKW